jgi:hypothetical protein
MAAVAVLRRWPARRWLVAAGSFAAFTLVVAVPTDLIDTPLFGREVPATSWAWPALLVSAALGGLLTATYVRSETAVPREVRGGWAGGLLTFLAVGCPTCNKLVLLAVGSAGALSWFQPLQPLLQVVAVGLLVWALNKRLVTEQACPLPDNPGRSLV